MHGGGSGAVAVEEDGDMFCGDHAFGDHFFEVGEEFLDGFFGVNDFDDDREVGGHFQE